MDSVTKQFDTDELYIWKNAPPLFSFILSRELYITKVPEDINLAYQPFGYL
jgi:hypothetical protein